MRRALPGPVAAAALVVALAGCGGDGETVTVTTTVTTQVTTTVGGGGAPAPDVSVCSNLAFRFTVAYPAAWHTRHIDPEGACFFFDPEPFDIPQSGELTTALEVLSTQQGFAELLESNTDKRFWKVIQRKNTRIAGRRAVVIEAESTGEGLLDEGARVYAYLVDRDGRGFFVRTTEAPGRNYAALKRVVDLSARSVRFTGRGPNMP